MDKLSQPFLDLLAKYTFVNITTMLKVPQSSKPAPLSPELSSSPSLSLSLVGMPSHDSPFRKSDTDDGDDDDQEDEGGVILI